MEKTNKKRFLYDLIHSLSKAEKQQFTIVLQEGQKGNTKSAFKILYDAILKQKRFDDKALKESLKGEKFVKHFSVTKNQLYNKLTDFLIEFHTGASNEIDFIENSFLLEHFEKKHLPANCKHCINKLEKNTYFKNNIEGKTLTYYSIFTYHSNFGKLRYNKKLMALSKTYTEWITTLKSKYAEKINPDN